MTTSQAFSCSNTAAGETSTRLDRWAFPIFLLLLALLCTSHALYFSISNMVPSTDEAHYMSGALSVAEGLRSGTVSGAWNGYRNALGFKPPLICVPAGIFMLFTDSLTLPFALQSILIFAALGLASYSLFRNCLQPFCAAMAAVTMLGMPLINGLAHRFYVELLLLLLSVVTLDVLSRHGWRSWISSLTIGFLLGLGVLCKTTSPVLLLLPVLSSLWWEARSGQEYSKARGLLAGRAIFAALVALATAASWYSKNLSATLAHSKLAASVTTCYYPNWFLADLSAGPSMIIAFVAALGLPVAMARILREKETANSIPAWTMILMLGAGTALALGATVNKCTRFGATGLPAFAILAVTACRLMKSQRWAGIAPAVPAAIAIVFSLHNSFEILPFAPIRSGDFVILDSRFPLNVPGWFDDNHPVDRRQFRLAEVEEKIAADAAARFDPGHVAEARTTVLGLLLNHDYFQLLSTARKHHVHYTWWPGSSATAPNAPDYIVAFDGFAKIYPGVHYFNYYPQVDDDAAAGRIPYECLFRMDGPDRTRISVFTRARIASLAAGNLPNAIYLEAERFQRGNVSVNTGEFGYGSNIGVIVTPKPAGFAEYDFNILTPGNYQIELRYASGVKRPLTISLDGVVLTSMAANTETGGFMPEHQRWVPACATSLNRGKHLLRIETQSLFPHLDRILIAPQVTRSKSG